MRCEARRVRPTLFQATVQPLALGHAPIIASFANVTKWLHVGIVKFMIFNRKANYAF